MDSKKEKSKHKSYVNGVVGSEGKTCVTCGPREKHLWCVVPYVPRETRVWCVVPYIPGEKRVWRGFPNDLSHLFLSEVGKLF